jgi:hypothetical protein
MGVATTGISGIVIRARKAICGANTIPAIGGATAIASPQRHGRSGRSQPAAKPQANHVVRYGTKAMLPFGSARNGNLDTAAPTPMHPIKNHRWRSPTLEIRFMDDRSLFRERHTWRIG